MLRRTARRIFGFQQPQHFLLHALAGKLCETGLLRRRRAQRFGVDLALAVPGVEAEQAQDAQIILADARRGVADEAHASGLEIGDAADRVENLAVGVGIERVHREVAALRVFLPVRGEGDDGAAAIGRHIAAQRRHFERLAAGDRGHRAVLDARRHRTEPAAVSRFVTSSGVSGVAMSMSATSRFSKRVAHRAADEARIAPQSVQHRARLRRRHPGFALGIEFHRGFSAG